MKKLKTKWITKNPETRLYQLSVPIIGLTGGIGTGKSTVAQILKENGIPIIDADKLVKNIYACPETFQFIATHHPNAICGSKIDFQELRKMAFNDPAVKKQLEDFIYSYLPLEFKKAFDVFLNPRFVVYDVPLLFEKTLNQFVDLTVCVYAPRSKQVERIVHRDKSEPELASKILDNQMDIEIKKTLSQFVIENTGSLEDLKIAVDEFFKKITS